MPDRLLEQAYLHTTYVVDYPAGPLSLRIGARCVPLDALLRQMDYETWAFVSACNPHSQLLAAAENAKRHAALLAEVRRRGLPFFPGRGVADGGGWAEESLLIPGINRAEAAALGCAFGQNAVVVGCIGGVAELVWCET